MRAQEIMTRDPACCTPDDSVRRAAAMMEENDCGAIPVIQDGDSRRVVGVVTDRDIATRAVARGRGADTPIGEVMSRDPECCEADDDVRDVEKLMAERQVRRVPIIDAGGTLVGIVAQADLALEDDAVDDRDVGEVVERISEPGRRQTRRAQAD